MPSTAYIQDLRVYFEGSRHFLYFLTDTRARRIYANDIFLKHFGAAGAEAPFTSLFEDEGRYRLLISQCANNKGEVVQAGLLMKLPGGLTRRVDWEFSACKQENDPGLYIQAIGVMAADESDWITKTGKQPGSLPERYKAYEQSQEGLWRFDSDEPVNIDTEPDEIIEYWQKHSFLAECNEHMARMYGYENAGDLIGIRLEQLIDFSDHTVIHNFRKFIRNGFRPTIIETREFDRYGNKKYFLNSLEGMVNNGKLTNVWGTQQDITEQRLAEEKLRYLAMLMENVSDIIISHDKDMKVISWNKAAEETFGYKAHEMTGKKITDVMHVEIQGFTIPELLDVIHKTGTWKGEAQVLNKFGQTVTALITSTSVFDSGGRLTGYMSVSKDITEKKKAEEKMERSELFYRNLIAESLDGIILTNENGIISMASSSVSRILGHNPAGLIGRSVFDFVTPGDRELAITTFTEEVNRQPRVNFINIRLIKNDGALLWCNVRGHNMLNNPYVGKVVIYFSDDTLRKTAELALVESEKRFRAQATQLANVSDVIVTTDMNRIVTSWNNVAEKLSGISSSQAVGRPYRNVLPTSYHPFTNKQVTEIVQQEGIWRGEISFRGFDGEVKYLLHTISLLRDEEGKNTGMMGVGKEITERKKMEAQLQQSELFYRNLTANSLDGIVLTDETGNIIHCGPSVFQISGYELNQLLGKNIFHFVHPDDITLALNAFTTEVKKKSVLSYIVIRLLHATRGWVWCTLRAHNLLQDPVLKAVVVYFADDSKRKDMEDRLRESESRFRKMIDNLKLGVLLLNEKSEMVVCNQAALDMLGLPEEQLMHTTPFDSRWNLIHENGSLFLPEELPDHLAVQLKKPVRDVVMGVSRPDSNDRIWLLVNAEPLFDDDQKIINVISSFTDITEQRRLSLQLVEQEVQRQKLITQATIDGQEKERQEIGKELHDNINQHLTTTRLYLEVASEKASGEILEMINLAHKNLAGIVDEIRMLSQSLVPPTLGDLGLVESVQDLCDALRRVHSYRIEFYHRQFSENDLPENMKLMIFRIIQEQVNNIIRHARAKSIIIRLQADAENIIFSIADDGQGFDPQRLKRGMGLTNISNRASLFDGKADIDTYPGKGCIVTVTIPFSGIRGN